MIIFNRRFAPSWLMTILTITGLALFMSLGLWQLDRAAYKDSIKMKFESRLKVDFRRFDGWESLSESGLSDMEFQKVIMRGRYDSARSLLIDNQLHKGKAGYHVLTPFELAGGNKIVLVNRGWVALGESREQLPQIESPAVDESIRGIVSVPGTDGYRLGEVSLLDSWPQVVPFIDIGPMQSTFNNRLLPIILWLDPEQAGHYQRAWNPVWADPEKSRAYAWQWFSFAIIALILFIGLNLNSAHST
jgi:surfeit locus 1 family protein